MLRSHPDAGLVGALRAIGGERRGLDAIIFRHSDSVTADIRRTLGAQRLDSGIYLTVAVRSGEFSTPSEPWLPDGRNRPQSARSPSQLLSQPRRPPLASSGQGRPGQATAGAHPPARRRPMPERRPLASCLPSAGRLRSIARLFGRRGRFGRFSGLVRAGLPGEPGGGLSQVLADGGLGPGGAPVSIA
jgi:hypothetical protein